MIHAPTTGAVTIIIAEDDDGHAELIMENLREAGVNNDMLRFRDGQETLDFFFDRGEGVHRETGRGYLLLLDIRMPKLDGVEVLRQLKADPELRNVPVIMLTTTDDPREIKHCYNLGCCCYVTKPVHYQKFSQVLNRLGLFMMVVQVPRLEEGVI